MLRKIRVLNAFLGTFLVGIAIITVDIRAETTSQEAIEAKVAGCPELPNVTWWKTTRIKIVKYVDLKYRGNWVPYIRKWETYKRKMQGILASNGTVLVKSRNIRLHGEKLALHIREIERRLEVIKCLKSKFSGQLAFNKSALCIPAGVTSKFKSPYFVSNKRMQISGGFSSNHINQGECHDYAEIW